MTSIRKQRHYLFWMPCILLCVSIGLIQKVNAACGDHPVYVEIGEYILKFPIAEENVYPSIAISGPEGHGRSSCWKSSLEKPIKADRLSTFIKVYMEGRDPISFDMNIRYWKDQEQLHLIERLENEDIVIENLPMRDGFYMYVPEKWPSITYIKPLSNYENNYLTLILCNQDKALMCRPQFKWRDNIYVNMSKLHVFEDNEAPLEIWHELLPEIIKTIDRFVLVKEHKIENQGE